MFAWKQSFPRETNSRSNNPLELVHKDVCGPIKPSSLGKSNYFLLFIDDFSRKTWKYSRRKEDVRSKLYNLTGEVKLPLNLSWSTAKKMAYEYP
ncbi:hypothetical protein V2J09_003324 [Rumex salicifolius]